MGWPSPGLLDRFCIQAYGQATYSAAWFLKLCTSHRCAPHTSRLSAGILCGVACAKAVCSDIVMVLWHSKLHMGGATGVGSARHTGVSVFACDNLAACRVYMFTQYMIVCGDIIAHNFESVERQDAGGVLTR